MPKTLAQLEREYQQYIDETRRAAKRQRLERQRLPKVPKQVFVFSRAVTIFSPSGKRIRTARWGKEERWSASANTVTNIKTAMKHALSRISKRRVGTVVYVNDIPIWEAKWGTDGINYIHWKNNPIALLWKRRLG